MVRVYLWRRKRIHNKRQPQMAIGKSRQYINREKNTQMAKKWKFFASKKRYTIRKRSQRL